jgi:endonuclease YncB( thermonuclease family)
MKTPHDKYFRILAQVIVDEKDVGPSLIAKGWTVPYNFLDACTIQA